MTELAPKTPRTVTVGALEADVARLEKALMLAQRGRDSAINRIQDSSRAGDMEDVAEARAERDDHESKIPGLVKKLEDARQDLDTAKAMVRRTAAAQAYEDIRKAVAAQVRRTEILEQALDAFAEAFKDWGVGLDSTEATMRAGGVMPNPYALRSFYQGLLDIRMHLRTSGAFGKLRTLHSADELRRSGGDSLLNLVATFQTITLQQARATLRVSGSQHSEA